MRSVYECATHTGQVSHHLHFTARARRGGDYGHDAPILSIGHRLPVMSGAPAVGERRQVANRQFLIGQALGHRLLARVGYAR